MPYKIWHEATAPVTLADYSSLGGAVNVETSTAGRRSVKTLPPPARGSKTTDPPWVVARLRAIDSPRPAPPASGGEVFGR
jgi:hypothetical protein